MFIKNSYNIHKNTSKFEINDNLIIGIIDQRPELSFKDFRFKEYVFDFEEKTFKVAPSNSNEEDVYLTKDDEDVVNSALDRLYNAMAGDPSQLLMNGDIPLIMGVPGDEWHFTIGYRTFLNEFGWNWAELVIIDAWHDVQRGGIRASISVKNNVIRILKNFIKEFELKINETIGISVMSIFTNSDAYEYMANIESATGTEFTHGIHSGLINPKLESEQMVMYLANYT